MYYFFVFARTTCSACINPYLGPIIIWSCSPPQATELNDPDRTDDARVIITIFDLNDHAPVFEESTYSANVSESLDVGDLVVTVTALDRDTVSP